MEDLSRCFPKLQLVATAHSPLIVQAAEGANLAVLRREGDRVTIDKRSQSVNKSRADQILASDFDVPPRSRPVESRIKERDALLDRANRNPSEEERLGALEEEIARLPTHHPDDQAAMDLIRSVAEKLMGGKLEDKLAPDEFEKAKKVLDEPMLKWKREIDEAMLPKAEYSAMARDFFEVDEDLGDGP